MNLSRKLCIFHLFFRYRPFRDLGKIWMEAVSQGAREGLNTELDLEKPAQPTYVTFFATYVTFGNLCHFLAQV